MADVDVKGIVEKFTDIVMEAPHGFSAGGKTFYIYPITLGKLMLIQRQLDVIGMDEERLARIPLIEVIGIVNLHRESCLRLLAFAIAKGKDDCFDVHRMNDTIQELAVALDNEDIATLMLSVLAYDTTQAVLAHYGIDKETDELNCVARAKGDKGTLSFGGKTVLGALVDSACERYGWTVDYCVWGIAYNTLRLMMADRVNTIYLSDEERKKVPAHILQRDEDVVKATKETMAEIKNMSSWR